MLFAATNNLSDASFVAPYKFTGFAALSVESAMSDLEEAAKDEIIGRAKEEVHSGARACLRNWSGARAYRESVKRVVDLELAHHARRGVIHKRGDDADERR